MRYKEIDIFKGLLTVQMILAHCLQFFAVLRPGSWQQALSEYINLTTFSGFLFSFGFVACHAYLQKPWRQVWKRVGRNAVRMVLAYWFSAFAYRIWIEGMPLHPARVRELLLFRSLAGWSEFLLSFAAVLLLILLLQPLMRRAGRRLEPAAAAVALVACLLPVPVAEPLLATFLGRAPYAVFAVLPYGLYFAAGVRFARTGRGWERRTLAVSAGGTALFFAAWALGGVPSRFPLSLPWLCGASLFVYLYYLAAGGLAAGGPVRLFVAEWLCSVGGSSLFYLLLSNLLIFALRSSSFFRLDTGYALASFVLILLACRYLRSSLGGTVRKGAPQPQEDS